MTLTQIKPAGLSKPVDLADNEKIRLGTGTDSEIFSDGTHTKITQLNNAGYIGLNANNFRILSGDGSESIIKAFKDGAVELYYDNDRKLRTVSNGAFIETASGDCYLTVRTESDNSSDDAVVRAYTQNNQASGYLMFGDIDDTFMGGLRYNNSSDTLFFYTNNGATWRIDSNGNLLNNDDTRKLQLGAAEDLQIYHDGSHSYIEDSGTGRLIVKTNYFEVDNAAGNEAMIEAIEDGAVSLYHNGSKRFGTQSNGFEALGGQFTFYGQEGGASQLLIYADEGDDLNDRWRVMAGGSNDFVIGNLADASWDTNIKAYGDGAVELYYDNSKKLETTSSGATVSGELTVNSHLLMGDGDKLRLGDSNDLELHHSGGENYIQGHTNQLYVRSAQGVYIQPNTNENGVVCNANSSTELYHNNTKKFETLSNGTRVYGHLGVNRDPAGSHPLWVQGSNQYVIGLTNTSAHASYFPWLLHKSINSLQAFGVHFNGLSGDPFHVDQNGAIYLGKQTATANALDDYEEGTWTPSVHNGGGSLTTVVARYTKIGRLVHIQAYVNYTTANSTSAFQMGGLPFACLGNDYNTCVTDFGRGGKKGAYSRTHTGNTFMEFLYSSESTSSDRITLKGNQIGSSYIIVSNTYMTS